MVEVIRTVAGLRAQVSRWHQQGLKVGLVPTMGALHAGHLSLVTTVLQHADRCVMSVFVNPTQFAPNEDFDAYPRREAEDVAAFEGGGGHVVFMPDVAEVYPDGFATSIKMAGPGIGLEQDFRPDHFDGVALVVAKLLLCALADVAIFGEKDYQQLQVIRRLVEDLSIPTQIISGAIVRDHEGLALSSRNAYLSEEQLTVARQLNQILRQTATNIISRPNDAVAVVEASKADIIAAGFDSVDYLAARSRALGEWESGDEGRVLVAAWLGQTRLIDNIPL